MKKALLLFVLIFGFFLAHITFASILNSPDCPSGNYFRCGVDRVGSLLGDNAGVVTGKGISQAVQDLVIYLLSFVSLIALIYIMYAGAQLLLNPADEESATKTKKIIIGVVSGILIIWLAWWIVTMIFTIVNDEKVTASLPIALAETEVKKVDFDTYKYKILVLESKIAGEYNVDVMRELGTLVDGAYQHLPDRDDLYQNKQYYDAVKKDISTCNLQKDYMYCALVENSLATFINQSKVFKIEADPEANPPIGDAPFSVTLEAKNAVDGSGTVIPNDNFIWWMRTAEGAKILGKGKIINHTFDLEGTYGINLTINSASRNSQGLTDVISLQKSVTIEVGQPKVRFVIKINDRIAGKTVKIPTKEAINSISLDASETVFASGYTTKTTEWDFGNGVTDTNEGNPQYELQQYDPGEHIIKLTLTRNDGERFSQSIILKIGDPLATIATNNKSPSKGEKVVFLAQKVSKETDVQYVWEVKKNEKDAPVLYSFSGTRFEYVFNDTGRYFVSLTSIKGDARDKDTMEVIIESRPPNVQFTSEIVSKATPNMYLFDGTSSFDPDYPDNQQLRFEWLVNDSVIQLLETNEQNSRGKYVFPGKGTYRVALRVTDKDGKTQDLKKDITITSILSLNLNIHPEVVKRGTQTLISVTAPQAATYEWKIGAEDPVVTRINRITKIFPVSGAFPITVKVTNEDGDTNSVTGKIYVTNEDKPFALMNIQSNSALTFSQASICNGQEALSLDRANSVSFSADRSVNTDGKSDNLTYFWKIGLNKTSTSKSVSYTFDELGCEEIILTVSDKKTGVSHTTQGWVKIINLAPRFSDMQVVVENPDNDPIRINLKLTGAKDPDGVIRSYTWYYYTDRDDQAQGFRITNNPETTFVLPKISGRYFFDVLMEDSNGLRVNTKEVSETRFSTSDLFVNTNLATPIIGNFQADATEVNFGDKTRLSLTVRTALDSDVAAKSEYRWDIDGDGFYDIKTTTPEYVFQYKSPGEYHPKVKVTHKGVSATESLTITVKNRLIPRAVIQMIGNKIVAYNMSAGVFQTVNWYIDEKKISENRDYLVFDTESSTSKKLKLEISDGKVTESVIYPIERNLKNQILLKKITGPLIVLSPASGSDMIETPENIVWEDPLTPMFIYLGESRGDAIRYYLIDTDIELDTDLNGQKNDDVDNKGTASYRNGRPFQLSKGTKRVTIMRIRLVGENNEDIASRQIRVTRTFLALPEDVTIIDNPKTFNLSQEDKERIQRLRDLVQIAPEEEKVVFDKLLDQLGDIWYDRVDRTQTLILFSQAVDASTTLSADLKKKILEQINLIYTQGDDQMNERQSARKIIEDLLSKHPKKLEIFGDGNTIGLIDTMLDNPEYYEANLAIKQNIYDKYVETDKTLSKESKQVIAEKLMLLAGAPLGKPDTPPPPPSTTNTSWLSMILWILGGILCIIFGGIGIVYARQRMAMTPKDITGESQHHEENTTTDTSHTSSVHDDASTTPDWLKEGGSPFGDEDVFSEKATPTTTETHQPDWIHDTEPEKGGVDVLPLPAENLESATNADLGETGSTPIVPSENTIMPPQTDIPVSPITDDTPDWLNSTSGQENVPEVVSEDVPAQVEPVQEGSDIPSLPVEDIGSAEPLVPSSDTENNDSIPRENEKIGIEESTPDTLPDEDMPDWLRGSEVETSAVTDTLGEIPVVPTEVVDEKVESLDEIISDPSIHQDGESINDIFGSSFESKDPTKIDTKKNVSEKETPITLRPTLAGSLDVGDNSLLESGNDMLLGNKKVPVEKKPKKKPAVSAKKSLKSGEKLLESEHDMLLPPSHDNPIV